jgi:hypothetical protein
VFKPLRGKGAMDPQPGPQRFFDQVGPLNSGRPAAGLTARIAERPAQLFQARILLTLYNANRHGSETIQCCADSKPFCQAASSQL